MSPLNLGSQSGLSVDDGDGLVLYQANVTLFGMVDGANEYIDVENREQIQNMGLSVQSKSCISGTYVCTVRVNACVMLCMC